MEQFTAWITKYALTKGILRKQVEVCGEAGDSAVRVVSNDWGEYYHGEGKDWHRTRIGAAKRAEKMRHDKIISLRMQIARLETLSFVE